MYFQVRCVRDMQHQSETIQFCIPADTKHVAMVRRAIGSVAISLGFPKDKCDDIELSVSEALANAIEHGSPDRTVNSVTAVCKITEDALVISVRDEGGGFAPPGGWESGLWNEHGRGLRLIYTLMDNVKINRTRKGGSIRMVKKKPSPEPPEFVPASR